MLPYVAAHRPSKAANVSLICVCIFFSPLLCIRCSAVFVGVGVGAENSVPQCEESRALFTFERSRENEVARNLGTESPQGERRHLSVVQREPE
jgi:hypothetical protein